MIRQFDVYSNPVRRGRNERPCVIVLQHRLFSAASSRIMAPLVAARDVHLPERAMPTLHVNDRVLYLMPTDLFTLPTKFLREALANLEPDRERIIAALDLVFTGI